MKPFFRWLAICVALLGLSSAPGQEKKPDKKDTPRVVVSLPLGVPAGATTRITLRGLKLDTASEIRAKGPGVTVKIVSKGKASVPNQQNAAQVGDTQIEADVTLPADAVGPTVALIVVTPAGESVPHQLLVDAPVSTIKEKEPNNGFLQAQPIHLPQAVDGTISQAQDVDVYRFEGKAGQTVLLEVLAARHGSALDSLLTLHDSEGHQIAANDDGAATADSRLEVTLSRPGTYFVSVMDARDQGGPAHVYRLTVRLK